MPDIYIKLYVVLQGVWREKLTVSLPLRIIQRLMKEEADMSMIRVYFLLLLLVLLLSACIPRAGKDGARIHCPACGTEFDALYQKRY